MKHDESDFFSIGCKGVMCSRFFYSKMIFGFSNSFMVIFLDGRIFCLPFFRKSFSVTSYPPVFS